MLRWRWIQASIAVKLNDRGDATGALTMIIPPVVHDIADHIAGKRGSPRWRLVTGLTGWAAALAIAAWLITSILGFPGIASAIIAVGLFLFPIASRLLDRGGLS